MGLPRIQKGKIIRASFLNDMAQGVDDLREEFISSPRQVEAPAPAEVQNESAEDAAEVVSPTTYIETSRSTSTVQVYDQNDTNYAEVSRIETVTLTNSLGESLVLKFNNG